jgi:putative transposase
MRAEQAFDDEVCMPNETEKPSPSTPLALSSESLYRFQVISAVRARVLGGEKLSRAVRAIVKVPPCPLVGSFAPRISVRSVYRWLRTHQDQGIAGLQRPRRGSQGVSRALPESLVAFFRAEKSLDRYASVPELLRRARELKVIGAEDPIDRVSAWRACRRMELPLMRVPKKQEADMRRFAYPHRMMMVLADGKHFRAGIGKTKRVALFFIDDATRLGMHVVVGTAESAQLFLRGLYEVLCRYGYFDVLYLDNGPGFIADDTAAACAKLGIHLILGTRRYPEGHGKIERFNQTVIAQLLRGLCGVAEISDDCGALELRLLHYLQQRYNRQPHEALHGRTPLQRFESDSRALRFPESMAELGERFVVTETRKVSRDNVLQYLGNDFEVPRGHAGTKVTVYRRLLSDELFILHDGRRFTLHPVDLLQNAISRRARPLSPSPSDDEGTPMTAARLAFERDFGPVVDIDGGFIDTPLKKGDLP